jgi:ubiquinone/menaquinone biosynthesis C-methylase UbiE
MMNSSRGLRSRATGLELIDLPVESRAELEESFRDIAFINRRFGGTAVARHALSKIGAKTVLDVACGVGDIAATLRREALQSGRDLTFVCLDSNETLVEAGRERHGSDPGLAFVCGNAMALPFADGSFDSVICNLAFHHFTPEQAVTLLREMRRVSRMAPLVTDLHRSTLSWLAAFAFSRVFTRNRLTRHDAPLSARRAYTPEEAARLASLADWQAPRVERFGLIRMVLFDAATI